MDETLGIKLIIKKKYYEKTIITVDNYNFC